MGVSAIGGSADMAATRKQMMDRVFKKMDSDGNGTISKDELQKAADERKAATGKDAPTNLPSVDDFFKAADANGDGGITQDELLTELSKMGPPPGKSEGTQTAQGDGQAGSAHSKGRCGGGSSSASASDKGGSSTSSSKPSVDPADADGDGKVSAAERRANDYKQLMTALAAVVEDTAGTIGPSDTKAEGKGESLSGVAVVA